jgi:hypothetical protein
MTFDQNSGRLFWAMSNNNDEGCLVELDPANGAAFNRGSIGNNAEIIGLYILPTSNDVHENLLSNIKAYSHLNQVYIINEKNIYLPFVQVVDMYGRIAYEGTAHSSTTLTINVTTGFYIVRLISKEGYVYTKKVYLTNNF